MATLTVQLSSITGTLLTLGAAGAGGDDFPNDGRVVLVVNNSSGSGRTVTVNRTRACTHGFDHDAVVAVANGEQRSIGPFPVDQFGESVSVTYDNATGLTVAARRV